MQNMESDFPAFPESHLIPIPNQTREAGWLAGWLALNKLDWTTPHPLCLPLHSLPLSNALKGKFSTGPQNPPVPMAVEARHLNPFPPQPTQDRTRDMLNPFNHQGYAAAAAAYNSHHMHFVGDSLPENHAFCSPAVCSAPASRKRARDQLCAFPALQKSDALPPVAAGDALFHIQQFQMDIDSLIADHSKRIRLEFAERQKQQAILLAGTIGESMMKRLKEKDDQIQRLGKLNLALQEKVKSLYVENQLLRDLAQSNEAAANSLRTNLQQVLLHEEEVGSCCGSIDDGVGEEWSGDRRCRMCRERESCVVVLPCRHLCLCDVCGSGSHHLPACPVCHSTITANLHINLSNLN